jgi:hypothetical protein
MTVSTIASPAPPASPAKAALFPKAGVEACLREELIETGKAEAGLKGIALPSAPADIAKTSFHVDSLVVVSILCTVEPIVGFELPDSVVRAGGYASVDSALTHLLPRIEAHWIRKKGGQPLSGSRFARTMMRKSDAGSATASARLGNISG